MGGVHGRLRTLESILSPAQSNSLFIHRMSGIGTLVIMSDPTHQQRSRPARPVRVGALSTLGLIALVLAVLSSVSLAIVLIAAFMGQVLWGGFTIFPAVFLPVAFMLMCMELARTALRRRRL